MADNYNDVLKQLAADLAKTAGVTLAAAREVLARYLPHLARWTAEANAADEAGQPAIAKKRRASIKHVRNMIVLDVATKGVEVTNKVERTVLSLVDKALARLV